jgi:hypothetical protein
MERENLVLIEIRKEFMGAIFSDLQIHWEGCKTKVGK